MHTKRVVSFILCVVLCAALAGCFQSRSNMPFNGEITFHQIKMTIPSEFIRDSAQSSDDVWLFEQGWYKKTIVIMRRQLDQDPEGYIGAYADAMQKEGIRSELTQFQGMTAARTSATKEDGVFWQELCFALDGCFYAVALNGGTEAEFQAILDTIAPLS